MQQALEWTNNCLKAGLFSVESTLKFVLLLYF